MDNITRICLARRYSADTVRELIPGAAAAQTDVPARLLTRVCSTSPPVQWLRLLGEANAKTAQRAEDTGEDRAHAAGTTDVHAAAFGAALTPNACTFKLLSLTTARELTIHSPNIIPDSLLPLFLPSRSAKSTPSDGHALMSSYLRAAFASSETTRTHALTRLLEQPSPGTADHRHSSAAINDLAMLLLENLPPVTIQGLSKRASITATSAPDAVTSALLSLLTLAAAQALTALFILCLTLLSGSLPQRLGHSVTTALDQARAALAGVSSASPITPEQVELANKYLDKLERRLDPAIARKRRRRTTGDRDRTGTTGRAADVDAVLRILLSLGPASISSVLCTSLRAREAHDRVFGSAVTAQESRAGWARDLLEACMSRTGRVGEIGNRAEVRWRSLTFGVLPSLLSALDVDLDAALAEQTEEVKRHFAAPVGDLASRVQELEHNPAENLVGLLRDLGTEYSLHAALAATVREHLASWTTQSDLPALASFFRALTASSPRVVDYLLLHLSPDELLGGINGLLESWDGSSEEYGAGHSLELFGSLLLSNWTLRLRHPPARQHHARYRYSSSALAVPSDVHSLEGLSHEHTELVASWIGALYGAEGIDDELIRSTAPRVMLALAPTIVHQSLAAHAAGVIDTETLNGGLSYFTQDILNFALPGIVRYCVGRSADVAIVKGMLMAEGTPNAVWELCEAELRQAYSDDLDIKARLGSRSGSVAPATSPAGSGGLSPVDAVKRSLVEIGRLRTVESIVQMSDTLYASVLLVLPLCGSGVPLLRTVEKEYLPMLFSRLRGTTMTDEISDRLDNVADVVGLACQASGTSRTMGKGRKAAITDDAESAFWERVDSMEGRAAV